MHMQVVIQDAHIAMLPDAQVAEITPPVELDSLGGFLERLRDQGCGLEEIEAVLAGLEGQGSATVWLAES